MNLIASFGIDFRCLPFVVLFLRSFAFDQAWIMARSNVYYRVIINGSASTNNREQKSHSYRISARACAAFQPTILRAIKMHSRLLHSQNDGIGAALHTHWIPRHTTKEESGKNCNPKRRKQQNANKNRPQMCAFSDIILLNTGQNTVLLLISLSISHWIFAQPQHNTAQHFRSIVRWKNMHFFEHWTLFMAHSINDAHNWSGSQKVNFLKCSALKSNSFSLDGLEISFRIYHESL